MGERLVIKKWADDLGISGNSQLLKINTGERPAHMSHSNATGEGLVTNGQLGVDVIRLEGGDKFQPHTHPGDHLLIVVAGEGTITYDGKIYPTRAGQAYMVEGAVPHAVGAITDHVILAVGSPHKPVDSTDRMVPTEYESITANLGNLHCLICDIQVNTPNRLHQTNCKHCPCPDC